MNQLNKKPNRTAEQVTEDRKKEEKEHPKATDWVGPPTKELLEMVGGDTQMTWVKGEGGMRLRNVLTLRGMHVKQRLYEKAVEEGKAKPKERSFIKEHIAPLWAEDYVASSSEDEEAVEKEAKARRKAIRARKRADREHSRAKMEERAREKAELRRNKAAMQNTNV